MCDYIIMDCSIFDRDFERVYFVIMYDLLSIV